MWEDRDYDEKAQNYFNVIVASMRDTLTEYGISEMVETDYGMMRVRTETFDCDLYRYLQGEGESYLPLHGNYMTGYVWAEVD